MVFDEMKVLRLRSLRLDVNSFKWEVATSIHRAQFERGVEEGTRSSHRIGTSLRPFRCHLHLDAAEERGVLHTPLLHSKRLPAGPSLFIPWLNLSKRKPCSCFQTAESRQRNDEQRDLPADDATSRLSVDLHFGTLHPRQIVHAIGQGTSGRRAFLRQLGWRDFYADVLSANPTSAWNDLHPLGIDHDDGHEAHQRFVAWATGMTGFPLVDAGMRQLLAEGFMHNRVRMIAASFLVKDLHLPWQWGAHWFLHRLVDGDLASNSHGWQWVAGVGTDASPYFRVFNPTLQAKRFDPNSAYIERWIPELGGLDLKARSFSGTLFDEVPRRSTYPEPLVDHAREREEAIRRLTRAHASVKDGSHE